MTIHLPNWAHKRVLVWGDAILDRYWQGNTQRISPEAPVPIVHIQTETQRLGGAANVAQNIRTVGAQVELFAPCGADNAGDELENLLNEQDIAATLFKVPDLKTITKLRVMSMNQQLIRLDFEQGFHDIDKSSLISACMARFSEAQALIISDYGKGGAHNIQSLIQAARKAGLTVLVDPKATDYAIYRGASVITPNWKEFEAVVGPCPTEADVLTKARRLLHTHDIDALLITRGAEGMTLIQGDQPPCHLAAKAREVFDVTGAGDTVVAITAVALAGGLPLNEAVSLANIAAGIVVGKLGTASVTVEELSAALHESLQDMLLLGVVTLPELRAQLPLLKQQGRKIVMTNGCFDILHSGHVMYLDQAKALGDYLIVAVNDDDSVKRLKGTQRPLNGLSRRMAVLAGLKAVDWVIPFSEDTPQRLIEAVLPDILVKGGDWAIHQIAGAQAVLANGGQVIPLGFEEGVSTTLLIEKIGDLTAL